jgi:hypothetical protein
MGLLQGNFNKWNLLDPLGVGHTGWLGEAGNDSQSKVDQRNQLTGLGRDAEVTAGENQQRFNTLGGQADAQAGYLNRIASGQESIAREQLRQGLQQNVAAQRSLAAGAAPQNAAMAARTAAMNMGRQGMGMSGQAAMAGIQERRAANEALTQLLMQQRQQELQSALGNRQIGLGAYTGTTPEASNLEKWGPAAAGGAGMLAKVMSDERLKKDIKNADDEANEIVGKLKPYRYSYKDEKHGKGSQFGVMAQELERAGLGNVVENTPEGKAVNGARLAAANTAMISALGKRLAEIEKKKGR